MANSSDLLVMPSFAVNLNATLDKWGVPRNILAAIVTDNPSVMQLLRESFTQQEGCEHMLQTR